MALRKKIEHKILMVDHRSKNQLESCGSYSKSFLMDPQNKNQEKGPGIRTRHWHWHWLCFSAFFHWGGLPPPNEKNEKNKANLPGPTELIA